MVTFGCLIKSLRIPKFFANCALWSRYISCFDVSSEQVKKVVGKFLSPEDNFLYIPIHIGGNHWCLAQINIPG
jgi:hypothetical protein